jgi:hypothetical protein
MLKMERPLTACATEQNIINVVDAGHINMGDWVYASICHTLLLLFFRSETLSQWL